MGATSPRSICVYTLQPCADVHLLKEGVDLFNEAQRQFRATWSGDAGIAHSSAASESEAIAGPVERSWSVREVMAALRPSLPPDGALLVFTSELLASGAYVEVQSRVTLVSTFGWDVDADPPRVDVFALYNLAACAFRIAGGHLHEAQTLPHRAPIGCLFDANVPDADRGLCALKIRLRCGYLCASHRVRLSSFELQCDEPLDAIDRVLDRVRTRATSTSPKGRALSKRVRQGRTLFSWVHLSDVHVGHGDDGYVEDQKLTLQEVERDLKRLVSTANVTPDAVLVTGDLAFSGATRTESRYKRAKQWLRRVAASAGLAGDRCTSCRATTTCSERWTPTPTSRRSCVTFAGAFARSTERSPTRPTGRCWPDGWRLPQVRARVRTHARSVKRRRPGLRPRSGGDARSTRAAVCACRWWVSTLRWSRPRRRPSARTNARCPSGCVNCARRSKWTSRATMA